MDGMICGGSGDGCVVWQQVVASGDLGWKLFNKGKKNKKRKWVAI